MLCPGCHGLMVSVTPKDPKGTIAREPIIARHCLLCGEVCDPVIAENPKAALHGQDSPGHVAKPFSDPL